MGGWGGGETGGDRRGAGMLRVLGHNTTHPMPLEDLLGWSVITYAEMGGGKAIVPHWEGEGGEACVRSELGGRV